VTTLPEAYPLAWPDGWPRTPPGLRQASAYKVSLGTARDDLMRELGLVGRHGMLSTNIALRRDGLPYADAREPADPGAAVYWDSRQGEPMSLACDSWRTVRENIRALGLAIESLRQLERCGASAILERAYSGFKRLPAPADPWAVLGVQRGASRERLTARLRELAREHHPDRGGSTAAMAAINAAYAEALNLAP
jgi:hypothetical protein